MKSVYIALDPPLTVVVGDEKMTFNSIPELKDFIEEKRLEGVTVVLSEIVRRICDYPKQILKANEE